MRVLVTGGSGQLGQALLATAPGHIRVTAPPSHALDISCKDVVKRVLAEMRPEVVINAAAYTAVDRAESEPDRAYAVNAHAAACVAEAATAVHARVIHVSTDFVFPGRQGTPYRPEDTPEPLNVYGHSKLAGERDVREATQGSALIVRTAWLYAGAGRNFVTTMLRLMAEREAVRVVADQVGTPTWAQSLARAVWAAVARPSLRGILHLTDAGVASWYDFALAIQEEALSRGLLAGAIPVHPIASTDYPTPAQRPGYSVLDKTRTWAELNLTPLHWRDGLRAMLDGRDHA